VEITLPSPFSFRDKMRITITDTINLFPESGREEQYLHSIHRTCATHSIDIDEGSGLPVCLRLFREPRPLSEQYSGQQLVKFVGPANILFLPSDSRWRGVTRDAAIAFCSAYGRQHAVDMIAEYRYGDPRLAPVTGNMIRERWKYGWHNYPQTKSLTEETGLWIQFRPEERPTKIL
jgi:hypothetical protein